MRVKSLAPSVGRVSDPYGSAAYKRRNEAHKRGERVLEQLPISSAKPTLPRLKFLESADE